MSLKTQECASKSTRLIWSQYSFYTLRKCFQNHRLSDGFKEYRKRTLAEKRLTQREDFFSNYSTFIFTFQLFWIYIKVYRRNFCALATWLKRAWEVLRNTRFLSSQYHVYCLSFKGQDMFFKCRGSKEEKPVCYWPLYKTYWYPSISAC